MKNILTVLILLILPVTSVYAKKEVAAELNSILNGVYDDHSNWQCIGGSAPLGSSEDFSLETLTTSGVITYNGDGTAQSEGRVAITRATTPPSGDIADYTCEWTYEVFEDRTFIREGECDVVSKFTEEASVATDQIWFGKIKGKGAETLMVERHDGGDNFLITNPPELILEGGGLVDEEGNIINIFERVCGKTGIEIIRE